MALLADTSSSIEKKISKQGFCLSKFKMPADAITFCLGMWWISGIALPHSLLSAVPEKNFAIRFKSCRKTVVSLQFKSEGVYKFPPRMNGKEVAIKNEMLSPTAMFPPSAQRFRMKWFQTTSSKIFPEFFVNRVKTVKFFTSYIGEAFLLYPKIKEVISMIMNYNQDTRMSLHRRMAAPQRVIQKPWIAA